VHLCSRKARVKATAPRESRRGRSRCRWASGGDPDYIRYHDRERGRPVHRDRRLFELLVLEGAQAGLSWATILGKRGGYRRAFAGFAPRVVAGFDARRRARLLQEPAIVRHRLKIAAAITHAQAFLKVQREFGSFSRYLWGFVDGRPQVQRPAPGAQRSSSTLSHALSKDLAQRGFRFVGPTIVYSYLQAVGVVNDHERGCHLCPPGPRARRWGKHP